MSLAAFLCASQLLAVSLASFVPRDFSTFPSEPVPDKPGVRRFRHSEAYRHSDGSDLSVQWVAETDPATIMSVDTGRRLGVRILECDDKRLVLKVPAAQAAKVSAWRHVTASSGLHNCWHLIGKNLYHRIEKVEHVQRKGDHDVVTMAIKDLPSATHIFHKLDWSYNYMPASAKDPEDLARHLAEMREGRRLNFEMQTAPGMAMQSEITPNGFQTNPDPFGEDGIPPDAKENFDEAVPSPQVALGDLKYSSRLTPTTQQVDGMFDLSSPDELSKMHWNWNYLADCADNPEFEIKFPGGDGWARFYKPYVKATVGVTLNSTSELGDFGSTPVEKIKGEIKGWAKMRLDVATAVDFTEDAKMDPLNKVQLPLPILGKRTNYYRPIKFFVGQIAVSVDPGFSCHLNAYHVGRLEGSLHVSLDMEMSIDGQMEFDTVSGLSSNLSAKAKNVKLTPPTWMVFTKHFELGAVLEPEIWLKGGMGEDRDMKVGWGVRPFLNVSIMEKGYEERRSSAVGPTPNKVQSASFGQAGSKSLIIYPYRVVGLPDNEEFMVRFSVGNHQRNTTPRPSINGVLDFQDAFSSFQVNDVQEEDLLSESISVEIVSYSQASGAMNIVGKAEAHCTTISQQECSPGPSRPLEVPVVMNAGFLSPGTEVAVLISTAWTSDPKGYMEQKVRGMSFNVTDVKSLSSSVVEEISKGQDAELHIERNGRTYVLPLVKQADESPLALKSDGIYNMGLRFLDAFKLTTLTTPGVTMPTPKVELYVGGAVVGTAELPPLKWTTPSNNGMMDTSNPFVSLMSSSAAFDAAMTVGESLYGNDISSMHMPVEVALKDPNSATVVACTVTIDFTASDSQTSAYWVEPYEDMSLSADSSLTLHWTIHTESGMLSGVFGGGDATEFELMPFEVGSDGSLTRIESLRTNFSAQCSPDFDVKVHTYIGDETPCIFSHTVQHSSLTGKTIKWIVGWIDTNGQKHRMPSPAITISSRRLQAINPGATKWGVQQSATPGSHRLAWQGSTGESGHQDFLNHMAAKGGAAACNENPLEYSFGFGVLEREDMKGGTDAALALNFFKDMMVMSGMGQTGPEQVPGAPESQYGGLAPQPLMPGGAQPPAQYPAQPQTTPPFSLSSFGSTPATPAAANTMNPLQALLQGGSSLLTLSSGSSSTETEYQNLLSENMNQSLADLLPESLCSGGICSGSLPGCKPQQVKPISIREMVFRLSRFFKIEDIMEPELRAAVAYGLSLAPEALELVEEDMGEESGDSSALYSQSPTAEPTAGPTTMPTAMPTAAPTAPPSLTPTLPTPLPTDAPASPAYSYSPAAQSANSEEQTLDRRLGRRETKTLVVRVNRPMLYNPDVPMIEKFIKQGAFNLLSDGREKELGPVRIVGVHLRERGDADRFSSDQDEYSGEVPLTLGSLCGISALGFVAVFAARRLRKGLSYEAVDTMGESILTGEAA